MIYFIHSKLSSLQLVFGKDESVVYHNYYYIIIIDIKYLESSVIDIYLVICITCMKQHKGAQ